VEAMVKPDTWLILVILTILTSQKANKEAIRDAERSRTFLS